MLIENPEALKSWLTTILEPKCDADPNALAKYVIALVKKDKPLPDLKETCIDQLDVFLQQETKPFVELLFRTLETKSYLKKNESQSLPPAQPQQQQTAHSLAHQSPVLLSSPSQPSHMGIQPDSSSSLAGVIVGGGSSNMGGSAIGIGSVAPSSLSASVGNVLRDAAAKDRDSRGRLSRPENLQDTDERDKRSLRKPSPVNRSRSRSRSRSSRSRSRNRSRSRSRDRDERRPTRRYNEEVKRDRRGLLPRRYDRYNDYSRHDRMRDRDRSRDRERESDRGMKERGDRTRSRSRTPRSRTRSRSRSRSPRDRDRQRPVGVGDSRDANHKTQSPNKLDQHGDKDYRYSSSSASSVVPSTVVAVSNQQPPVIVPSSSVAVSAALPPVPGTVCAESQAIFSPFPRAGKSSRRCRDFDEMGYCMRGDLCPYDHGSDPVVVEDVNLPGMIGFPPPPPAGQGMRPAAPPAPIPPIMGHPPIPRPQLPPPPQPHPPGIKMSTDVGRVRPDGTIYYSDPFLPEPYNPEAPSLDRPPRLRPSYWNPRPALPRGIGMRPAPIFQQQMARELISVPTIDNPTHQDASKGRMVMAPHKRPYDPASRDGADLRGLRDPAAIAMGLNMQPGLLHNNGNNASDCANNLSGLHRMNNNSGLHQVGAVGNSNNIVAGGPGEMMNKRRPFDFNRLGPRKNNSENSTLELRKIPRGLNSITELNNHFAKFGRIVNLQVCFEGNPEAALITFSSHAEANAAYRSTEAVLNNRFIKVFWHNKENNEHESLMPIVTPSLTHTFGNRKLSVKDRLGVPVVTVVNAPASPENNSNAANSMNNSTTSPVTTPQTQLQPPPGDDAELLKASVVLSPTGNLSKTVFNPAALKKNNVTVAPTKVQQAMAVHDAVKKKQVEKRKEFMKINSDIQKRKQELLEKYIQDQKALIERLEKKKNMIPAEREKLLLTVRSIQSCSFKKEQMLASPASRQHPKTKTEAQKLLLDFEMDLYNKQHQGADTTELKKRVAELKQEARALGLLDSVRGGRGRGRGRGVRSLSFRGRGVRSTSVSVDHRPRKLLVTGLDENERDEAMLHLAQFGEIEGIDHDEVNHFTVLTFRTRKEAEMFVQAMLRGPKFRERSLNVSWFKDHSPDTLAEGVDVEGDVLLVDDLENVELLLADDEDEEDSEARSWKR